MMDQLNSGNFEYTPEELKAIGEAMKQKEFRDLLVQYVEEISDPKNKEEYDQYLKQLEGSRELPKGMKLIQPTACFCLKTKIKNKKNPNFNQKLFINVCMSPELEKPAQEKDKKHKHNERGQQWHVPYSVGKIRMDQDKHKNVCQTVDIAFNPLTFEYGRQKEAFHKMICEISVEAASKQLKDADENISKDYKILKTLKCKGGKPAVMPVRFDQKPGEHDQARQQNTERNEDQLPKLYQEFVSQQKEYKESQIKEEIQKNHQSGNGKVVELASHDFETIEEKAGEEKEEEEDVKTKKIVAPKYNIVHSYGVDYADYIMDGPNKGKKIPKTLTVKVEVPRVEKLAELDLDISEKHLILKAENKYYLDITLPYKVLSDEGKAKFDSKTKTLSVALPTSKEQDPEEKNTTATDNGEIEHVTVNKNGKTEENGEGNGEIETTEERDDILDGTAKSTGLKFVTEESQRKYREEQEKMIQRIGEDRKLVEEIETPQNGVSHEEPKDNKKEEEKKEKTVNRDYEFNTQDTFENYFFIFKITNYEKENVKVALLEEDVLLSYEDKDRELSTWIKLLKGYDKKASQISYVKDHVVINLKKTENEFWENKGWKKHEYNEEFNGKMKLYEEEKQREEEEEKQRKEAEKSTVSQKEEEGEKNGEDKEEKEEKEEEIDEQEKEEKEAQKIEERFVEKRSINFINYDRNSLAFEID